MVRGTTASLALRRFAFHFEYALSCTEDVVGMVCQNE